jgi:hypothetical protein
MYMCVCRFVYLPGPKILDLHPHRSSEGFSASKVTRESLGLELASSDVIVSRKPSRSFEFLKKPLPPQNCCLTRAHTAGSERWWSPQGLWCTTHGIAHRRVGHQPLPLLNVDHPRPNLDKLLPHVRGRLASLTGFMDKS